MKRITAKTETETEIQLNSNVHWQMTATMLKSQQQKAISAMTIG